MKKRFFIAFLITAALILAAAGVSCASQAVAPRVVKNVPPPEVGQKAPDVTVADLSGKSVSLNDFTGESVLLDFWAVDCDQCLIERDLLEAAHQENPDIQFMMVDSKDRVSTVKRFVKNMQSDLPVYTDDQMTAAVDFDVHIMPETFLINRNGIIEYIQNGGFTDPAQLKDALKTVQ